MMDHNIVVPEFRRWEACFYCGSSLPAKSKEHIFNSSWTGKHKTGSLICDTCNAAFADEVDKAFIPYIKFKMNVWNLKGERHKDAPTIKTNEELVIRPGGKPENPPSLTFRIEDGKLYFTTNAPDKATIRRLWKEQLPEIESMMGRSLREDEHQQFRDLVRQAEINTESAGPVKFHDSIDPHLEVRSTLHTILKCIALYDPNFSEIISKDVLNFSRYGNGDWRSFAVHAAPRIVNISKSYSSFYTHFNAVEVHYLPNAKQIVARLAILRSLDRWVVLSNHYEGPAQILFVAEPSLSGILQPMLFTFSDNFPSTVKIEHVMEYNDFVRELVQISQWELGPGTLIAQLINRIEQISAQHTQVSNAYINEFRNALLTFFSRMVQYQSKITGVSVSYSEEDMQQDLMSHGIAQLEGMIGANTDETYKLLVNAIRYISNRVLKLFKDKKTKYN